MLDAMEEVGMSLSEPNVAAGRGAHVRGSLSRHVAYAAIGVFAAVITVLAVDHQRAAALGAAAPGKDGAGEGRALRGGEEVIQRIVVDPRGFDRLAALERRVRELQEAHAPPAGSPLAEITSDPAEIRRNVKEMYAELDRAHDRDAPDPRWAPGATSHLVTGLTALGERLGFTVGATDCKTTTCRATVTWGNYATAHATGVQLVEELFEGLSCAQKINLLEPSDPNAPYATQLYLDCTELRAGLAGGDSQRKTN
jgi:hypothetical protein